jgi:RNA-directed DNA polymerase
VSLSPLLANIALHGLEVAAADGLPRYRQPQVVRYADDFVVMHDDLAIIRRVQEHLTAWLAGLGLELKPSKTRIAHTLLTIDGCAGFDFLGFSIRQFPVGKTHSGKLGNGQPLGFKTIIRPTKEAQKRHLAQVKRIVRRHQTAPQAAFIDHLNPVIRGWTAYYSSAASAETFHTMDQQTFLKLRSWAYRRHPNKNRGWIVRKYWRLDRGKWTFGDRGGTTLARHAERSIRRHIKVQGRRSPLDGDWVYWGTRLAAHPELPTRIAKLLRLQHGTCASCGLFFKADDLPEVDHIVPKACGGKDEYRNWQLLHRHCHDAKTASDGLAARGLRTKNQITEEPDASKDARPVLKTSRPGDRPA